MFEKISLNISIKSSNQDEKIILDSVVKNQANDKDKKVREQNAFNNLVNDKINEEKNRLNFKKKPKKIDDISGMFIPIYTYQTPIIQEHYLNRIRNSKKKKCSKCGELFEPETSSKETKSKIYICQSCLNNDIESFLRENYL